MENHINMLINILDSYYKINTEEPAKIKYHNFLKFYIPQMIIKLFRYGVFLMPLLIFVALRKFHIITSSKNIMNNNIFSYVLWGYTVLIMLVTLTVVLTLTMDMITIFIQRRRYVYQFEDLIDIRELKDMVYPNHSEPELKKLIYLKSIVSDIYDTNRRHRNSLFACFVLFLNVFVLFAQSYIKVHFEINDFIIYITISTISCLFTFFLTASSHSPFTQFDSLFIRQGGSLLKLKNLLDYIIYQKTH
ncbi:hypothetical protein [Leuconostoc pseudomesenteroides]|uniref:hypothetical protein n=1 Tax=Leuconostoc pseudomesenteroides TaxID=33968 RepID=UPI00228687C3|nr:hypothetical protein [Leuconostoc pseudomesenteroides]WAM37605.1 hypothetical protein OYT93_05185 [Leuconostoc pseudomesenteroides]